MGFLTLTKYSIIYNDSGGNFYHFSIEISNFHINNFILKKSEKIAKGYIAVKYWKILRQ